MHQLMQSTRVIPTKKVVSIIVIFLLFFTYALQGFAQEMILHEEAEGFPVAQGVTYEGRTLFTSSGWLKIHILKLDLSSENVDIDAIMNKNGVSKRQPLSKMVVENGAIAGINGDFFPPATFSSPVGIQITNGKLISSPDIIEGGMAAFALTYEKIPQLLRFQFTGKIQAPDGTSYHISGINKASDCYNIIMIYTPDYGKSTPVLQPSAPEITYAVVKNDKIVNIFDGRSAEIPEDSIVLAGGNKASLFLKKFTIGDEVKIDFEITPDISNLKMALGGGAILVENGVIPSTFSHDIPGRHPRTAIGFTKDGKTLILVVVDGRQAQSRGMTQEELARLMLSLGAYNALNLDGGGSSTMVVRAPGEKAPTVINSVSDKTERSIVNGLGIFSRLSSSGKVYGFKIVASSFNIPKNGRRVFEIKAYDENYNPVDVDPNLVQWSISGGLGTFKGNVLYAEKSGVGTVTASLGDLKASANVRILGDAVEIIVEPGKIQLSPGGKQSFSVYAVDALGYKAPLEPEDITWEIKGSAGSFESGVFTAPQSPGAAAVIANFLNLKAGALIKVGESGYFDESLLPTNSFRTDSANVPFKNGGVTFGVIGDLLMGANYGPAYQKTFDLASSVFEHFKTAFNVIAGRSSSMQYNYLKAGAGYFTHGAGDTFFIFLDASKGSLRLTNPNQWVKLKEDMKSAASKYKNLVIVLDRAPEAFQDPLEGDLLKKILSHHRDYYQNVLVLGGGAEKFSSQMVEGIKYIHVPGVNAKEPAALVFNIQGDSINYRVLPLIEKVVSDTPAVKKGMPTKLKLWGISPTGYKIPLEYPYSVSYTLSPAGIASFDAKNLSIDAKKAGEIDIIVKTEVFTGKVKLQVVDITIKVNGKEVNFPDQQPYINSENRTMVPVRFVAEDLGAKVYWDDKNKQVTIEKDNDKITLKIGEKKAIVNGKTEILDTRTELKNSRTMVPLRFICEALGAKVLWDPTTRTVEINK